MCIDYIKGNNDIYIYTKCYLLINMRVKCRADGAAIVQYWDTCGNGCEDVCNLGLVDVV